MKRSIFLSVPFALAIVVSSVVACSSSDSGGGGTDGGTTSDSGGGGSDSGSGADTGGGGPALNGCTSADYVDMSAASAARTVVWDFTIVPPCMTIKAGQTVTFNGNFGTHPIASFNGDTPNPFDTPQGTGGSRTFTFPTAGSFGFHCQNHSSMHGAVNVLP